jgi:hypothetical protein
LSSSVSGCARPMPLFGTCNGLSFRFSLKHVRNCPISLPQCPLRTVWCSSNHVSVRAPGHTNE